MEQTNPQPTNPQPKKRWLDEAPKYMKTMGWMVVVIAVLIFIFGGENRMSGFAFLIFAGLCFAVLPLLHTFSKTSTRTVSGQPMQVSVEKKQQATRAVIGFFFVFAIVIALVVWFSIIASGIH